ncbi:Gfo/Idh/MocA family protein [Isoptericola sp. NPDC056578]|uniref:Gfo/Idh/MocA family protein n=1 Tax=Isoptericola sp. NPDC056578 TaxID=3345870 RepID=UPI0036AB6C6A
MRPVTIAVVGAGHRGAEAYADYCLRHPDEVQVVAVAEPDDGRRAALVAAHGIAADRAYSGWEDLLAADRIADAVVVATPDRLRTGPLLAAARRGYAILVEKPVATSPAELEEIVRAVGEADVPVGVAHVLRYTAFFRHLKELLDEGAVGRVVHLEQTEDPGYWHFVHSYVRGSWRRADTSSPLLLAKACHDLDVITWLLGAEPATVYSTGALTQFRAENAPEGAPERCTDGCPAADACPFHAPRFYVERLRDHHAWPVTAITGDTSAEGRLRALREGPYGRCVYRCDNDAVDHQVVALTYAAGVTATLRVGAFTEANTRTVRILGSHGEIEGRLDTGEVTLRRFLPRRGAELGGAPRWDRDAEGRSGLPDDDVVTVVTAPVDDVDLLVEPGRRESDGHAGGDDGLMREFVATVRDRRVRPGVRVPTHLADAAVSHRIAFAAERSRSTGEVVHL